MTYKVFGGTLSLTQSINTSFVDVQISVTVKQRRGESDVPTLKLVVDSLGMELRARDFVTSVDAYLGGVCVQHMLFKGPSAFY